jgi:flagellar hook-basal body complex protein FliE
VIQSNTSYGLSRNSSVFAARAQGTEGKSKGAEFQDVLVSAYSAVSQDEQQFAQTLKAWSTRRGF